jgi:hypothetical protein
MGDSEPIRPEFQAMLDSMREAGAFATEEQVAEYERAQRRELRVQALASSGLHLPDEDRRLVLSGRLDRTKVACATVATWARGAPKPGQPTVGCTPGILVLCGGVGTGKTLAAAWWLSHVRGRALTIHEAVRVYTRWKRATYKPEQAEEALERIARIDCLVLDELGQESDSDAETAREVLHWIVDRRQSARRRTLIITNLTSSDLGARFVRGDYDGRTADRLKAHGQVVEVAGESMRRRRP